MLNIQSFSSKKITGNSHLLAFNARDFYVVARSSYKNQKFGPSLLFVHQSIELYIKAFLKYNNVSWEKGKKGHDLIRLLEKGKTDVSFFDEILKDKKFKKIIQDIQGSYCKIRYGESSWGIEDGQNFLIVYDKLIKKFIGSFFEMCKVPGSNYLIVPDYWKDEFRDLAELKIVYLPNLKRTKN